MYKQEIINGTLGSELKNIKNELDKEKNKRLFNKFMIAFQDINRLEKLESIIPSIFNLRINRNEQCHYINDNDTPSEIIDKRTILLDKKINMPSGVKSMFDKKYPSLLKDIEPYIAQNPSVPSQQSEDDINDFWD